MKYLRITFVLFSLSLLTSCGLQKQGLILMTDESYKAQVFAANQAGLGAPDGLVWRGGKLYLANEGSDKLQVWSKTDGLKQLADSQLGFLSPEDLVIDNEGNIFFTDDDAGGLWEVDQKGKASLVAGKDKGLISTEGIALAPDGSILVGDGEQHKVFRVTRAGEVSEFLGQDAGITKPESMVFDDRGNLFIADNEDNVLYLLDVDHKLHRLIERRESFSPETIFYSKGSLYITDSRNGKLYVYNSTEELRTIAAFGGQLKNVQGVTIDESGTIFVGVQTDLKHNIGSIIEISKENPDIAQK
jgi:sugar lactone lactonase YvrE